MSSVARGKRSVRRRTPGRSSAPANWGARTALQKHVDFFDTNHDGKITLSDTYRGLRRLGFGTLRSAAFAGVINTALGSSTSRAPSLTVDAGRIHAGKHRSDTGVYDQKGRFSLARFNRLFAKYDANGDGALDGQELERLFSANRTDLIGHLGSRVEFGLLLEIAGEDRNGKKLLTRQRLEHFYDGSLFHELAEDVASRRASEWAMLRGALRSGIREIY